MWSEEMAEDQPSGRSGVGGWLAILTKKREGKELLNAQALAVCECTNEATLKGLKDEDFCDGD
jgi:hypothetical protein